MKVFYELCREVVVHGWSKLSEMPFRGDEGETKEIYDWKQRFSCNQHIWVSLLLQVGLLCHLSWYFGGLSKTSLWLGCWSKPEDVHNNYQLYNWKALEAELKSLQKAATTVNIFTDSDLLRHNLVVFRAGENAL